MGFIHIMTGITAEIDSLAQEIEEIKANNPQAASLLQAFGPMLLARSRWLARVRDKEASFSVDALRFQNGVPLIGQCQLLVAGDPWREAGIMTAQAIGQGFPLFNEEMARLSDLLENGRFDPFVLVDTETSSQDNGDQLMEQLGISRTALDLFQRFLVRLALCAKARDAAPQLAGLTWNKGNCPVCGSLPHLAILREQGQKWLQCPDCSHEWQFPRLTCPACDHEDPQDTNLLFIEGKKHESVFTCNKCRKYLITVELPVALTRTNTDLLALSLVHLDLIMQDKELLPMAECEWNIFRS